VKDLLAFLNDNAGAIQALTTVALVLITIWYARLTRRLVDSPHLSHLRPSGVYRQGTEWAVRLKNDGPGQALDVTLLMRGIAGLEVMDKPFWDALRDLDRVEFIADRGTVDSVPAGQEADVNLGRVGNRLVRLQWRTVTRRQQQAEWLLRVRGVDYFGDVVGRQTPLFGDRLLPVEFRPSHWVVRPFLWMMTVLLKVMIGVKRWMLPGLSRPRHGAKD